MKEILKGKR
uniref:Uncharacterized protein n=1 Tax=Anguilla anguilla TaxID=7936 RepID=A0A0E9VYF0_ANGAN